jgi:hypothetical protein
MGRPAKEPAQLGSKTSTAGHKPPGSVSKGANRPNDSATAGGHLPETRPSSDIGGTALRRETDTRNG